MKPSIITLLFLTVCVLTPVTYAGQPSLNRDEAIRLIDEALQHKPLLWSPFPLPYEVAQADRSKDAILLSALVDHDLLVREKTMGMVSVEENGVTRRKIRVGWKYDYPQPSSHDGFYYGVGRLKSILELSRAYLIGQYYYAEAYIQWYVDDLQYWVQDAAFDRARTLRRSRESYEKPFETRVFLMHDGTSWGFWDGQPGQL